jgi:hypothetical protein
MGSRDVSGPHMVWQRHIGVTDSQTRIRVAKVQRWVTVWVLSIHLQIVSTNRVTAEVNIYPSGSSIVGYATASYRSAGTVASFSGTMTVERGSGRYKGTHGSGLSFTGTVERSNDTVVVHVRGRMST